MAFIYHIKAFLVTWVRKDKQIYKHTYIQTHFSENNFSKPGVRPQLAEGRLWRVSGLIRNFKLD